MAITFTVAGTVASAASGNITPTLPAGFQADDIFVMVVYTSNNTAPTFPGDWTTKLGTNNGATQRVTVAWARATGGSGNPLVTHSAGFIIARIAGFRGVTTSGDPFDAAAAQANASSATITAPDITTTHTNDMVLFCGGWFAGTGGASGYSGTNPTFTEAIDNLISGEDQNICLAYGIKSDAAAVGSRTATITAGINVGALLSLFEGGGGTDFPFAPAQVAAVATGQTPALFTSLSYHADGDVSAGNWTPSTGGTLWGTIDEGNPDDADYDVNINPAGGFFEVSLANAPDPAMSSGHYVNYRIEGGGSMVVSLRQGAGTEIASWSHNPAPAVPTTFQQVLTSGQTDAITDYTDLRLRFEAVP